ncbi:MAG: TPM domain-containing protein [Candidatus Kryptoniota bacterium]
MSEKIASIESRSRVEIRIVVRHRKHWSERRLLPRQLAEREFHVLGMSNTKEHTGILIFILVKDRKFEIVADTGVNEVVPATFWDNIASKLSRHFTETNFFKGLIEALKEVEDLVVEKLPAGAKNTDELPNDVIEE